jgi:hypothetical protein
MSRQAVEQALGKLGVDVRFHDAFFCDPTAASLAAGIELTDQEFFEVGVPRPQWPATYRSGSPRSSSSSST